MSPFSIRQALHLADRILSEPPAKPHIVRPVLRGERVFRFVLPLELCKTTNNTSRTRPWEAEKIKSTTWDYINSQASLAGIKREPLPGRPQVICTRFSSREPDAYSNFAKIAVDMLTPPSGKHRRGLNLLRDDRPSDAEILERWERAPMGSGCVVVDVRGER